jgi:hypothetical protein
MASPRRGIGWVFAWMTRRTAAAYGLVGEALALLHEQRLGFAGDRARLLLLDVVAASRRLGVLLVALKPALDGPDLLVALADLGARHRPAVSADGRSRCGYIDDLLSAAGAECAKLRRFLVCAGERKGPVVALLDEVAAHLAEARDLLDARFVQATGIHGAGA